MRDFLNYADSIDIKFLIFTLLFILICKATYNILNEVKAKN